MSRKEDENSCLQVYKKACKSCGKVRLVPNGYEDCLGCLRKKLKLQLWEEICLQCGKKQKHMPDGCNICLDCLEINSGKAEEKLEKSLSPEQEKLLEDCRMWNGLRTSYYILMS